MKFSPISLPNPHLVAITQEYDEEELLMLGTHVNSDRELFPHGANVSVVVPLAAGELFVTFERGAGLTPSCGSGAVASACIAVRERVVDPDGPVVVRNVGGPLICRVTSKRETFSRRSWRETPPLYIQRQSKVKTCSVIRSTRYRMTSRPSSRRYSPSGRSRMRTLTSYPAYLGLRSFSNSRYLNRRGPNTREEVVRY